MLGYPGMGKRTVGSQLADLIDGVLVDNQLINRPLLELFRWDGKESMDPEGYRWHRLNTTLFEPPSSETIHLDTTETSAAANAERIHQELQQRGFAPGRRA